MHETVIPLRAKYREGRQYKGISGRGAGDNPQNNPRVARTRQRAFGKNPPKGWGTGK